MPDISMCRDAECPARAKCYRNQASGTQPSEYRQAYANFHRGPEFGRCFEFWPTIAAADLPKHGPATFPAPPTDEVK
jgi:hypothetical protein